MAAFPCEPYVPTLGEYAEVIAHFTDGGTKDTLPPELVLACDDAVVRAALRRVARVMEDTFQDERS